MSLGSPLRVVAIDNRIRGPLTALIATVILTSTVSLVQLARLRTAQAAYVRASIQLTADEPRIRGIDALRAHVLRQTQLSAYVAGVRRISLGQANELIWIGNRLPAQTWLRVLRYENGSYSLEGTADRAAAVGTAMLALHDETHATIAQLVSLQDDGSTSATRIRYSLRLQTQP